MKSRFAFFWLWLALALLAALEARAQAGSRGVEFRGWSDFAEWERRFGVADEVVLTSPVFAPAFACDELVASWNADAPENCAVRVEARALYFGRETRFYSLGQWSLGPAGARASVPQQKDADGEVMTDTVVFVEGARRLQLRVTLIPDRAWKPSLRFVGVTLLNRKASQPLLAPNQSAWGVLLEVPRRSQVDYPGGEQSWCSPTSLSMVLSFWSRQLKRPELDKPVSEVARGVMDPQWPGTGNWSFNTAYAGSFPKLRAYVARFSDVSEIEDWIQVGVPVVASVDYDLLRGQPRGRAGGHLVVVVGFSGAGDPVINDPGTRHETRRTFARSDFARAWATSRHTVYLVHPESLGAPKDRFGHWYREPSLMEMAPTFGR
ncbi:MAG: peptidase C39 family protein [Limisphaerales bacterium]